MNLNIGISKSRWVHQNFLEGNFAFKAMLPVSPCNWDGIIILCETYKYLAITE